MSVSERNPTESAGALHFQRPFAQLTVRGDGPQMEQWITSATGRSWKITLIAGG
jgi:hypothetical protein